MTTEQPLQNLSLYCLNDYRAVKTVSTVLNDYFSTVLNDYRAAFGEISISYLIQNHIGYTYIHVNIHIYIYMYIKQILRSVH